MRICYQALITALSIKGWNTLEPNRSLIEIFIAVQIPSAELK
jgi:hypothetical protein